MRVETKTQARCARATRIFNLREGFTRKNDTVPQIFFEIAVLSGPTRNRVLDPVDFDGMLDGFYELCG